MTITLAVLVAVPLGVLAAWRFGGWLDRGLMAFSVLGFSVPVFVLAYLLIWLVSLKLGWLPVQGYQRFGDGVGLWLKHLILPAITLSVIYIALIARVTRASVLETLGEDYIRTARAKGLPEAKVLLRHALANAAVPIATVIGIGIALLIGGVVVTESVYAIPGLGRLTVDAVLARDFPTIQGVILLFSFVYVLVNLRSTCRTWCSIRGSATDDEPRSDWSPTDLAALSVESATVVPQASAWSRVRASWSVRIGGVVLVVLVVVALLAPWLGTVDPSLFDPASRDLLPGKPGEITTLEGETLKHTFWMGSDSFGRDIYSRVIYGTQVSLVVGVATALLALAFGIVLGLCAGYLRWLDGPLMRVMDGVMAIPAILIAIALVAMWKGSLLTVVVAIAVPEIPRVTRLVRSLVLSIREEPYVEAAISLGTPTWLIMGRHILPNCVAPLVVQGTFICASGILVEAILSFLGVGLPPDIPTWGNVMAEGRAQFNEYPHNIFFPGIFLAVTVLAVNILGDGLRDTLDPKMAKRV